MIPGQTLPMLQLELTPVAVLAAVVVPSEEERVGNLTAETARDVDELRQANDRGARQCQTLRAYGPSRVSLDNLGLSVNDQTQCALEGHHRQGLERRVQRQATNYHAILRCQVDPDRHESGAFTPIPQVRLRYTNSRQWPAGAEVQRTARQ